MVSLDEDGNTNWEITDLANGLHYPSWHPDGFLLANGGALYAFDPADGSILWGPVLEDDDYDSTDKPIIDAEGYIFVVECNPSSRLVCLNSSGVEIWRTEVKYQLAGIHILDLLSIQ